MAKMKTSLSVSVIFSLCFLTGVVLVLGSSDSESDPSENPTPSPSPSPAEYLESLGKYFKGLEERNRELEKSQEEFRDFKSIHQKTQQEFGDLKANYETSHAELKEEFKTLKEEMHKLKNDMREDHGAWLLTPPLRGPPGKQGEKGDSGPLRSTAEKDATGQSGSTRNPGVTRAKGDPGISALQSVTSCSDAMEILPSPRSSKQQIYSHGNRNTTKVEVLCDFQVDGGGWTLIQKRSSGPRDEFNRTWNEYSNGFGSLDKNFWIGLENIHALTKNGDQELRIELEDFQGRKAWAKYSNFSISDASDFYRLTVSGFSGDSTANDSMTNSAYGTSNINNGMRFSTWDKDNDLMSGRSNAQHYGGGWWFNSQGELSHLNAPYRQKGEHLKTHPKGIFWSSWKNWTWESLAKTEMKIRAKK